MGHYDDIYDDIYEEEENKRIEEANRRHKINMLEMKMKLHDRIDNLDDDETEFATEVINNLTAYRGFFKILDRSRK